jgi:endonuclease/exonuclease/phosphatase family metal-dependent hydrolase
MDDRRTYGLILVASIILFFVQAFRVMLSVMFGVIYDQVFEGPVDAWLIGSNLLVIVSLGLPVLTSRTGRARWFVGACVLAALARIPMTLNVADIRFWSALVVLACCGLSSAYILRWERDQVVSGVALALVLDQLLRLGGDTYDLSMRAAWIPVQILWSSGVIAVVLARTFSTETVQEVPTGIRWRTGFAWSGFLFLETSLFSLPNGVARWSATPFRLSAPVLLAISALVIDPGVRARLRRASGTPVRKVLLILVLLAGLLLGYFSRGYGAVVGLYLAALAAFVCLSHVIEGDDMEWRRPGAVMGMAGVVLLVLNFLNAFTFTYPYTVPALREMGWLVYVVAAALIGIGLLGTSANSPDLGRPTQPHIQVWLWVLGVVVLALVLVWPAPKPPGMPGNTFTMASYNIHYGYDDAWRFTLEEIADTIAAAGVDVVALQEVDTGRLTSYAVDNAYYLGERLGMGVLYVPTVEHLTGIALLYRWDALDTRTQLLPSLQEQTAIAHVELPLGAGSVHAFGVWMGLSDEDTQAQIEQALAFIGARSPAAFGGDFNASHGEPVPRAVESAGFIDPFLALEQIPPPPTSPAVNPRSQIDFVWLRGFDPLDAWVSPSLASDHRMVVVRAAIP